MFAFPLASQFLLASTLALAPCGQAEQREAMQAGHEAYNRGEYSRAVSSWRGLYRCLEGEKSPADTRQMVVELILSAYYAADLLGPEISRVDEALELIADYRRVLGAESPPSIVVVWEEKLQERRARLTAEQRTGVLENSLAEANVALAQLRATQSVPVQVSKDLVPASRVRDAHRRAARAMIISGSVVVALGLAGGVALPIGLSQASSYGDKIDKAPVGTTQLQVLSWKNSKYHAESIAMFGGLSLLAIIPGAVVMGMGFGQLRNSKREISWNVSPNHVSATMRF